MSSPGIWTKEVSQSFYGNVNSLDQRLKDLKKKKESQVSYSPQAPEDYRINAPQRTASGQYLLDYENELHLADHFAFLAHFKEGVEYVSAATLEEGNDPSGFTIRLASNHTPDSYVVEGFGRILGIVRKHAEAGENGDRYKSELFDEVVSFSQERIYGRIRTSQWKMPFYLKGARSNYPPLSTSIDRSLQGIWQQLGQNSGDFALLRRTLTELREAIKAVDTGAIDLQQDLLKAMVVKSYEVSTQGNSKSLKSYLRDRQIPEHIYSSREVAEIDKLSKYLTICNDLIHLSRQSRTREYCKNIRLDPRTAYPESWPQGTDGPKCFVHGEVQLIIFYERYPRALTPRAIGSSKSACFLCDLFIKKHGRFGISYSHMKLYPQWTIPDEPWMDSRLQARLTSLVKAMSNDVKMLSMKKMYHLNTAVESRAHLLLVERDSSTESSVVSPPGSIEVRLSSASSETVVPSPVTPSPVAPSPVAPSLLAISPNCSVLKFEDLPVKIDFSSVTTFCELSAGGITYLFNFEAGSGSLHISNANSSTELQGERINTAQLVLGEPVSMRAEPEASLMSFVAHADGNHAVRITVTYLGS